LGARARSYASCLLLTHKVFVEFVAVLPYGARPT